MTNLPLHSIIRLISILLVLLITSLWPDPVFWSSIAMSLGLGHYLLSVIYAQRQISQAFVQPHSAKTLVALLLLGSTLYLCHFPLVIFFGLHHVFNEVYIVNRVITNEQTPGARTFRTSGVVLNFFIYFVVLRKDPDLQNLAFELQKLDFLNTSALKSVLTNVLLTGFIGSCVFFVVSLWNVKPRLKGAKLIDGFAFEVIGLGLVVVSFYVQILFLHVVFYHFVFWVLYPIAKISKQGRKPLARYFVETFASTALFLALSPIGISAYVLHGSFFFRQFFLWSYLHITSSFAFSNAHPNWIVRWFRP